MEKSGALRRYAADEFPAARRCVGKIGMVAEKNARCLSGSVVEQAAGMRYNGCCGLRRYCVARLESGDCGSLFGSEHGVGAERFSQAAESDDGDDASGERGNDRLVFGRRFQRATGGAVRLDHCPVGGAAQKQRVDFRARVAAHFVGIVFRCGGANGEERFAFGDAYRFGVGVERERRRLACGRFCQPRGGGAERSEIFGSQVPAQREQQACLAAAADERRNAARQVRQFAAEMRCRFRHEASDTRKSAVMHTASVEDCRIVVKSAGEMASGIAVRLFRAGFRRILMLETAAPLAVRRAVSFCEAIHDGEQRVEDVAAVRAETPAEIESAWRSNRIAVAADPEWALLRSIRPAVSIDAILAKRNTGTKIGEAPLVVALGPGFAAGRDAHRVIETRRGHTLGRVLRQGEAEPNTGVPGMIGGYALERVLRAPAAGKVAAFCAIGDMVAAGEVVCRVGGHDVAAVIDGCLRGCVRDGTEVPAGCKLGDVDPRGRREYCFTVSEKASALGGAVLEAVCAFLFDRDGTDAAGAEAKG